MKSLTRILTFLLLIWGCTASDPKELNDRREMRVFAYYSTTSITSLVTATTSVSSTCMSIAAGTACTGRRRRSAKYKKLFVEK